MKIWLQQKTAKRGEYVNFVCLADFSICLFYITNFRSLQKNYIVAFDAGMGIQANDIRIELKLAFLSHE